MSPGSRAGIGPNDNPVATARVVPLRGKCRKLLHNRRKAAILPPTLLQKAFHVQDLTLAAPACPSGNGTRVTGAAASISRPDLSIVVAAYNEEDVLHIFFERLRSVLGGLGVSYEIVCVNDGSRDRTAEILNAAHAADPRIKVVHFARNFGKELALTAGLDFASGEAVVPLDADLQDPPELIEDFLKLWREGYDVVYAVREARDTDSWMKRTTAGIFYSLLGKVSNVQIPRNAGDFRLMDRRVVEALRLFRERNRFMKGLFSWVGFRQTSVGYRRPERAAGQSKFNYWKLWNFALDGITGYSTVPLRLAGYSGLVFAFIAMLYGAYLMLRTLISGVDMPGYASLMVAVIFMGGVQLVVLGIIGEYLGRMYSEAKQRPLYIVESVLGIDPPDLSAVVVPEREGRRG
jgi:polyisoprenyl-phosphate glycosyltransferase